MAVEVAGQRVVCPDNGLLTLLANSHPIEAAHEISNADLRREPASATFEGRDVFAPAVAHLACGGALSDLGPPVSDLVELALPEPLAGEGAVRGEVMHVDRFGNAITNIPASMLMWPGDTRVQAAGHDLALPAHLRRRRSGRGARVGGEQWVRRGGRARGQRRGGARTGTRRRRAGRGYSMSASCERASRTASVVP